MDQAMALTDEDLRKSWHLARSNPDAFKAMRQGALMLQRKFESLLLTGAI